MGHVAARTTSAAILSGRTLCLNQCLKPCGAAVPRAEGHAEAADFARVDLMLRAALRLAISLGLPVNSLAMRAPALRTRSGRSS